MAFQPGDTFVTDHGATYTILAVTGKRLTYTASGVEKPQTEDVKEFQSALAKGLLRKTS